MARTKYTVTFPAARPSDEVTWPNTVHVYPDADTPVPLQSGQTLDGNNSFSGWSDAASIVFTRPAGDNDTVTVTTGSPTGSGAAAPSAPGGSSAVREYTFAFGHATPNLHTGVVAYTPTIGDTLLNAWIEITTAWNGTTPKADVGAFISPDNNGWWSEVATPQTIDMTQADSAAEAVMPLGLLTATNGCQSLATAANSSSSRAIPAAFSTTDPIKVVVSQDGTNTGSATGATVGAAVLHLLVSTPTASPG